MTTNDQLDPHAAAAEFDDLEAELRDFVVAAEPTDKNLHFAAFRRLDDHSFEELVRLATEGKRLVDHRREHFLRRDLYGDGMFWYEMFLAISSAALSYETAAGGPLPKGSVERLVEILVAMSEYSTAVTGDITKRNREALGNLLLRSEDEALIERARCAAQSIDKKAVTAFVEGTIGRVDEVREHNEVSVDVSQEELEKHHVWEKSDRVARDDEVTTFRRQARLQQARWREGKGYPIRIYRGHELGSLLEDPDDEGRNFLSDHIRAAVRHRLASKELHQQLEPKRLRTNMLSSMPLCFNLFGELWDRPDEATKALRAWLPEDMEGEVESVRFEWSPGRLDPQYLGNRTAFDAAFLVKRPDGTRGIVGVETKYHEVAKKEEAPGANRLPRYEEVVETSRAFKRDWREKVLGTKLQQIWLDHLLVLAMLQHPSGEWTWGRYVLVRPTGNSSFRDLAEEYRKVLANPETFVELTIEELLDAHVLPSDTEREFSHRYLW